MGRRPKSWNNNNDSAGLPPKEELKNFKFVVRAEKLDAGWVIVTNPEPGSSEHPSKKFAVSDHEEFLNQMFDEMSKRMTALPPGHFMGFVIYLLADIMPELIGEKKEPV